jgi:hypothetical protein
MRSAIYSKADYQTIEQGNHFVIRRLGAASNELRDGVVLILEHDVRPALALLVRAAGERTRNADFTGVTRHDYAAAVTLRLSR